MNLSNDNMIRLEIKVKFSIFFYTGMAVWDSLDKITQGILIGYARSLSLDEFLKKTQGEEIPSRTVWQAIRTEHYGIREKNSEFAEIIEEKYEKLFDEPTVSAVLYYLGNENQEYLAKILDMAIATNFVPIILTTKDLTGASKDLQDRYKKMVSSSEYKVGLYESIQTQPWAARLIGQGLATRDELVEYLLQKMATG